MFHSDEDCMRHEKNFWSNEKTVGRNNIGDSYTNFNLKDNIEKGRIHYEETYTTIYRVTFGGACFP